MIGFTDKVLLIYPKIESYENKDEDYFYDLKRAELNILKFVEKNQMKLYCLGSDEVSILRKPEAVWINTLGKADTFFAQNRNHYLMRLKKMPTLDMPDIIGPIDKKHKPVKGMSEQERIDLVLKKDKLAIKKIVDTFKFVIIFEQANNPFVNITPKVNDGRILLKISNTTFIPKVTLSEMEIDPREILAISNGNSAVFKWEV